MADSFSDVINNGNVDDKRLTASECLADSENADFTKQLIIVNPDLLLPEYRSSTSQLVECSHGNGARPNAIGRSVFGNELYSGETVVYDRSEILGIADEDKLPQWAKIKLEIQRDPLKEQVKRHTAPKKEEKPDLLAKINGNKQKVERNKAADTDKPVKKKNRGGQEV